MSGKFRNEGIELMVPPRSALEIECRPTQISQILVNLLSNAYDAVRLLPEKWVRMGVEDRGEAVEISVTDSGRGIPPQVRERIMQPFFTTKGPRNGTGLGLSIAKGLAGPKMAA